MTTTDTFGCKDSRTKNSFIRVNGPIAAAASLNSQGCKGLDVNFLDQSVTDGVNSIVKWQWDFGDGTSPQVYTQPPFTHVYDTLGNFDVKLYVQDAAGCSDEIFLSEFVRVSTLKADWSGAVYTCPNAPIYFLNNTKSQFPITTFWDFGDGSKDSSGGATLKHSYSKYGHFTVKLTALNQPACSNEMITSVRVMPKPIAAFDGPSVICDQDVGVALSDRSYVPSGLGAITK